MQGHAGASKKAASAPAAAAKPHAPARKSAGKANPEDSLSPAAKKAIAAVAEAVKKLPKTQELLDSGRVTRMAAAAPGGWGGGGGADAEPENHGQKDAPIGHPDCLTRYTFVISGALDSMFRQEATDYVKRHGGRVTTGVTGKTTFLLCGAPTSLRNVCVTTETRRNVCVTTEPRRNVCVCSVRHSAWTPVELARPSPPPTCSTHAHHEHSQ